jgi:hypothetical protein
MTTHDPDVPKAKSGNDEEENRTIYENGSA